MDTPVNQNAWLNQTYETMWNAANKNARLTEHDGHIEVQSPEDLMSQPNYINEHKQMHVANIVGQLFDEMIKNDLREEEFDDLLNCASKLKTNYEQFPEESDFPVINKLSEIIKRIKN